MPRTPRSQHRDALIAGLILVGALSCIRTLAFQVIDLRMLTSCAVNFISAFAAAQLARRVMVELDTGEVVAAAIVSILVVHGILIQRDEETFEVLVLLPLGVAALGALAGGLMSRRHRAEVARIWLVLGAGFAGYGAIMVAANASQLLESDALGTLIMFLGGCLGCAVAAWATPARAYECGLGTGIVTAAVLVTSPTSAVASAVIFGSLGALGGAIGAAIRRRRVPKTELPDARVRDRTEVSRGG